MDTTALEAKSASLKQQVDQIDHEIKTLETQLNAMRVLRGQTFRAYLNTEAQICDLKD